MFAPKGLSTRLSLLLGGDLMLSAATVWVLSIGNGPLCRAPFTPYLVAPSVGLLYLGALYFQDLYALERHPRSTYWIVASIMGATAEVTFLLLLAALVFPALNFGTPFYVSEVIITGATLIAWRVYAHYFLFRRLHVGVMVLGIGEAGPIVADEIARRSHLGYKFLGYAVLASPDRTPERSQLRRPDPVPIRTASSVAELVAQCPLDILVVLNSCDSIRELVRCRMRGIEVLDFHSFYERVTGRLPVSLLDEGWLLASGGTLHSRWRRAIKRAIDLVATTLLAILALPIALVTAIAIKLDSEGPIFYSQDRVGLDGTVFRVYKFRSMRQDAERATGAVWAAQGDPRVTRVGRIIRRLRIDELPQLLNVIMGEMSLIGPRPERPEIVSKIVEAMPLYEYRHFVRPGLTGWAQVCYPYGASIEDAREKLAYDLYYIKNWSLTLDLQIMLQTSKVVLFGRGAR
jgi:sugar transferase (PEP-CTERM system associated)